VTEEGIVLLAALARRARSLDVGVICDGVAYEGPRGAVEMRGAHADQRIYLADPEDLGQVVTELEPVGP
jgi:hypothetical protein